MHTSANHYSGASRRATRCGGTVASVPLLATAAALLCRPALHSAVVDPGHAETAGHSFMLYPLDIQFQLCCYCCRPRPELRFCWPPAVFASPALSQSYASLDPASLSRSRRFQNSSVRRHSLGPQPCCYCWTPSLSSLYWTLGQT